MSAQSLARQLFAEPGAVTAHTRHLLAQAAGSHARLLDSAGAAHQKQLDRLREALGGYLRGPASATEKRFVLDDPQFIEALHALASASDDLAGWDAAVAPGGYRAPPERQASLARGRLGNVVAAVLLRRWRHWCGQIELATDEYGRIHFPFCDWALVVVDERSHERDLFAHQTLILDLDEHEARWSLPGRASAPLVRMPRRVFDAMFVDNRDVAGTSGMEFCAGPPRPRFERASRLNRTRIRFEPISGEAPAAHAELTGAIVAALVEAIKRNAPHIHGQLCQCIRTIRGFELPPYGCGQIASFSVPTSPGVIGFNVGYTPRDEPQLSPYCFMWLGHELGHTVNYLIDNVAYTHGWRFLENPGETTPLIPRYGRSLTVRTLLSVPYVHLFEWWLLMLFHERGFAGLPWRMFDDTLAVGEDLRAEIDESFDLIDQHARLTATGQAVVGRLRELVAEADSNWRRLSCAAIRSRAN
ncbi:MAG: hypothetical protein WD063_16440 [Pirellulales bacterium]